MADQKSEPRGGSNVVSLAIDSAKPAPKVGKRHVPGSDIESPELPFLAPGCPVEPLGKLGQICFYLDEQKQLISLDPQKHGKQHIRCLFGRQSHLCDEYWPRFSDKTGLDGKPIITGWKPEVAADILMRVCAQRGIFDPQGKVRGTGAHRTDDGELVLHCGDKIFITGLQAGYVDPGLIAGYVYPAGPSRPRPDPVEQGTAAAEQIHMKLTAWNWQRPLIDPMLLLGHMGCAMVGGALDWRPHVWITGGSATGKSTLQKLLRAVHDGAALTTGNATEAGLRQLLKQQTLPVFFDELEAQEDNRKNSAVIELARVASSGDQVLKGGQNHEGQEFIVRSCFLFSSILLPPMLTQDRNRLAILELDPLEEHAKAPTIDLGELRELGRQLRRRLVDHWHRLDDLVDRYKTELGKQGHSGRSGDQFGTLLALADLMLYDVPDEDNILEWAERLKADTLAEKSTELPDEEEVVQRLATSFLKQRGGDEPEPVGRVLYAALQPDGDKARERLENFGMRIVAKKVSDNGTVGAKRPPAEASSSELYLAIANSHVALATLFADTRWSHGTWAQSFGRVRVMVNRAGEDPIEVRAERRVKVRFGRGRPDWATLVPLSAVIELEAVD
jgi:hypothetical protein